MQERLEKIVSMAGLDKLAVEREVASHEAGK